MTVIDLFERTRLEMQTRLDAAKTAEERNRLGQFATPTTLAEAILGYAQALVPPRLKIRFLDPAIGTGAFFSAFLRAFPPARVLAAAGYEIDPHYGVEATRLWGHTPLKLYLADFTRIRPPVDDTEKANLLICNPPYVRHHHLPAAEKQRLQSAAARAAGVQLSGLSGLYCYFVCIAHEWMAENGLAGWLIPSEFMDVNYGRQLKHYLLTRVTLLRVHRFDPNEMQFGDALVSSAVVWLRKAVPPPDHTVDFTYGGSLAAPQIARAVPVDLLQRTAKWTGVAAGRAELATYPASAPGTTDDREHLRLSDVFQVKRGIATGANNFFILSAADAEARQIPAEFLIPILPSPRYLPASEIQAGPGGNPVLDRSLFLISCDLSEADVQARYPALWQYLQQGVALGLPQKYLCSHRSPWYAQEKRPPAPFLCTYMGRTTSAKQNPFRFFLNHSRATAPNVYLMLYPKPALAQALHDTPARAKTVWEALNQITAETLKGEGRVYGGGLHKLEPEELTNAPIDSLLNLVSRPVHQQLRMIMERRG